MSKAETNEQSAPLIDEQLCFALYSTSRAITKKYSGILDELGLTYPQYLTMLVLWEKDGRSVQEIADCLELEGATTTPLLKRMESLDLVQKKRSKEDERRFEVFLTKKGHTMRARARDVPERLGCALGVTDSQVDTLMKHLRDLRRTMG
ncbi:MarR family transcriptional regulator [uncultured Ruegeria sp.]|uniref:MarR family winged helix-turn-helix transcriptional regulator n=1 Tax=uncultured Ruegeria sp. TaxID=259304 RepID=UPI00262A2E50|nr:MarR family transcriptional regulator [uncultured Ruegeria sp.]